MSTINTVAPEINPPAGHKEPRPALLDQQLLDQQDEEAIISRWLPDWMVMRLPRWNLPSPLAAAVIAAALFVALLAPIVASNRRFGLLIIAAILGIAGLVILVKWRVLGLLALPIAAFFVRYAIGTGTGTGINAVVVLLVLLIGLWLMDMLTRTRQISLLPYRPVIAALVFGVVAVVAFGFGQLPWFPTPSAPITAQFGGLLIFLFSVGAFIYAAHQIRSEKELKWLIVVFLGVGLLFFGLRLFPTSLPIVLRIFARNGVLGATFYVWLVAIAASQALFNHKLAPAWRILAGFLVLLILYVSMSGESRDWLSGWAPPLAALVVIIIIGRPDLGFFAALGGFLVLAFNTNIIGSILNEGDNTYSTLTRLEAWRIMAEIVKVNPIFGLGMANYYYYTPLFPILGYRINFNSHNNYIDIIAQVGLLGLVCFLWLLAELWSLGWRMRTQVPQGFAYAYTIGALGGLAGTVVAAGLGDWVIPFVYNIGLEGFRASIFIWIFLGGLVALARIHAISVTGAKAQSE